MLSSPVCIQDNGSMAAKQGYLVRKLSLLVQGNNRECAAAARLPVDGQELGVRSGQFERRLATDFHGARGRSASLDQIRVPSVPTDVEVVVAELLSGRLPEDVSYMVSSSQRRARRRTGRSKHPSCSVCLGRVLACWRGHAGVEGTHDTSTRARIGQTWLRDLEGNDCRGEWGEEQ